MRYYILTKEQAELLTAAKAGVNQGFAREMKSGEFATSENSANDFPDLFNWEEVEKRELTVNDFPEPENIDL